MPRLTKRVVDAAERQSKDIFLWDSELPAFAIRVKPSGTKSFFVQYRNRSGRSRRLTLGRFGVLTVEQGRAAAKATLAQVALGGDPAESKAADRAAVTVAQLCDDYFDQAERGLLITRRGRTKKSSTLCTDRGRIERHIKPLLGRKLVRDVTAADIRGFIRDVTAGKTKADIKTKKRGRAIVRGGKGTASRTTGLLGGIFSYAVGEGIRADNPTRDVTRPADGRRRVHIDRALYRKIGVAITAASSAGCPWQAIDSILLIALTGGRRGEICNLKKSEVDLSSQFLRLGDTKTGQSVRPIGREAVHIIQRAMRRSNSEYVFPSTRSPDKPFTGLPKSWNSITQGKIEGITPHSFRHGFASSAELSVIKCFETDGGVNYRSDRLI
jgi:integrase